MNGWSSPRIIPTSATERSDGMRLAYTCGRPSEHVLGDDLEHPAGTSELGSHLFHRGHGRDRSGHPAVPRSGAGTP